jgi:hypothetical protein
MHHHINVEDAHEFFAPPVYESFFIVRLTIGRVARGQRQSQTYMGYQAKGAKPKYK